LNETLSKAKQILLKYRLCSKCLGRLLSSNRPSSELLNTGEDIKAALLEEARSLLDQNPEEAETLVKALSESGYGPALDVALGRGLEVEKKTCPICLDRLTDEVVETVVAEAVRKVSGYEFEDFLVGAYVPKYIAAIEERIFSEFGLTESETLRKEVAREVGKKLEVALGKPANFTSPEMLILVDIFTGTAEAKPAPLYIYGHYFKSRADIPQTPWYCSACWGAGCDRCGGRGRVYPDSVAEYVGEPAMRLAGAIGYKFHAAGREDVDVTVEGTGRPFIVELIMPRRRKVSLEALKEAVKSYSEGRVEVEGLKPATHNDLKMLKEAIEGSTKRYMATVQFSKPVSREDLARLEASLRGAVIEQQTPTRVLKRRGEKLRRKRILNIESRLIDSYTVEFYVEADGGLYVKELIHGDSGRTRPSIAEILDNPPTSIRLKFLGVLKTLHHSK
jgi:tRNA pseudouridine synthase 10